MPHASSLRWNYLATSFRAPRILPAGATSLSGQTWRFRGVGNMPSGQACCGACSSKGKTMGGASSPAPPRCLAASTKAILATSSNGHATMCYRASQATLSSSDLCCRRQRRFGGGGGGGGGALFAIRNTKRVQTNEVQTPSRVADLNHKSMGQHPGLPMPAFPPSAAG